MSVSNFNIVDKFVVWQSHKQDLIDAVVACPNHRYRNCFIRYLKHKGLIAQGSSGSLGSPEIIAKLNNKIVADPERLVEVQKVLEQDVYFYTVGLKMRYELEDITLPDKSMAKHLVLILKMSVQFLQY